MRKQSPTNPRTTPRRSRLVQLTLHNEYLRQENKILKSKIKKRIVFTDDERRTLLEAALAMGRDLMEKVVTIVIHHNKLFVNKLLTQAALLY